jgi:hypothetical protein
MQPIRAAQVQQQLAVQEAEATQALVQKALATYEAGARSQATIPTDTNTAAGIGGHHAEAAKHHALYRAALDALAPHPGGTLRERFVSSRRSLAELPPSVAGVLARTAEGRALAAQVCGKHGRGKLWFLLLFS